MVRSQNQKTLGSPKRFGWSCRFVPNERTILKCLKPANSFLKSRGLIMRRKAPQWRALAWRSHSKLSNIKIWASRIQISEVAISYDFHIWIEKRGVWVARYIIEESNFQGLAWINKLSHLTKPQWSQIHTPDLDLRGLCNLKSQSLTECHWSPGPEVGKDCEKNNRII